MSSDVRNHYGHNNGVSPEGAARAGLAYGERMNAEEIQRAQVATYLEYVKPASPNYGNTQTYYPTSNLSRELSVLFMMAVGVLVIMAVLPIIKDIVQTTPAEIAASRLSNYKLNVPADVETLSATPSTVLYDKYLAGTSKASRFEELNPQQQSAVAAAWLRYVRQPDKFNTMPASYRHKIYELFSMYLYWRKKHFSDSQASEDWLSITDEIGPTSPNW